MATPLRRRLSVTELGPSRVVGTAALAVLLALGVHLLAGGVLPQAGEGLVGGAGLTAVATWLGGQVGRRTRGLSASTALLLVGQGALEVLLWTSGHTVLDPLLAVVLHSAAAVVLVVVVLGLDRVSAELEVATERILPRLCWSPVPDSGRRRGVSPAVARRAGLDGGCWGPAGGPVRGPPLPA